MNKKPENTFENRKDADAQANTINKFSGEFIAQVEPLFGEKLSFAIKLFSVENGEYGYL